MTLFSPLPPVEYMVAAIGRALRSVVSFRPGGDLVAILEKIWPSAIFQGQNHPLISISSIEG